MLTRILILALSFSLLTACATTDTQQAPQPYMGAGSDPQTPTGNDIYNVNKNAAKPESSAWGWLNNQY